MNFASLTNFPKIIGALAALGLVAACDGTILDGPEIDLGGGDGTDPRVINADLETTIPGQFIVVFDAPAQFGALAQRDERTAVQRFTGVQAVLESFDVEVMHDMTAAIMAIGIEVPEGPAGQRAIDAFFELPEVDYIVANQRGQFGQAVNQPNPTWGLDRVDQRVLPFDNNYRYDGDGTGVHAYVIDSGMRITHNEFGGRATNDFTVQTGGSMADCANHGTHVAGTIGGATFGVAKDVWLHNVRVGNDSCVPDAMSQLAGINWVTANRILPAVANMSIWGPSNPATNTAIQNSIASGVTYVVIAGNGNSDACNLSPASAPNAITVGSVDNTDTRAGTSGFGPCVDIFAPGVNILSASNAGDNATTTLSGTSMAAPHVAGVAARYLADQPLATPADVWNRIDFIANEFPGTAGWAGIANPGAGSPNRLLVWQALNDARDDGDPHLRTVDGTRYDFHAAGEFVALMDRNGTEIQTRQIPVPSANPLGNAHTGISSCVSVNSAVAARVGARRVSYQPEREGDDGEMVLRIDGVRVGSGSLPVNVGGGGRVSSSPNGNGIEVLFPDGTRLIANPWFWSSQSQWALQLSVFDSPAREGLLGLISDGQWLPALADGSQLGPRPAAVPDRFVQLNQTFADSWRVEAASSLFDYAPGETTQTHTDRSWPPEGSACRLPDRPPVEPVRVELAQRACADVIDRFDRQNCVMDVQVTGEVGFAEAFLAVDRVRLGATRTDLTHQVTEEGVRFVASVARLAPEREQESLAGVVNFTISGEFAGESVRVGRDGRAVWAWPGLGVEDNLPNVVATFVPSEGSGLLPSTSFEGNVLEGLEPDKQ